jgi:hypothetical protein
MDDQAPIGLTLGIAAFRAIAAAVTEAEIGGDVPTVTISQLAPDLQLMEDAVGVELIIGDGPDARRQTWIVAGDGRVVSHVEDPGEDAADDPDAAGEAPDDD